MRHAKGPLLTVDVGERTAHTTVIDDVLAETIGGRALATRLAHDRVPFEADPLGPDNRAYVSTGPLQVARMSFTGRMNMTALSPLTEGLVSTNAGGYLSRNFADTGHPAVEVVGESDELLVVHVTDEGCEFEEVPELEGAEVPEVSRYLEETHGLEPEHQLAIGPAGENLVRYACVMTYETRAFGRGGLGAVLGAKNVKAMTFHGDDRPAMDLPEDTMLSVHKAAAESDDMMRRQGTTSGTEFINDEYSLPTRYFTERSFEDVEKIGGDAVEKKKYKKGACSACAYACKLPTKDEERGVETEGPEFETVFSFGSNQGVADVVDVMISNDLCDRLGMDTISCGDSIAAYLAAEDEFGNAELVHDLVEQIAYREGIGDTLAEGIDRFHDELGVENWSVKGLEFAAHDGRVLHGQGLSYAVANRGADHMYGSMLGLEYGGEIPAEGLEGKPARLLDRENWMAIRDSAVLCAFGYDSYVDQDALAGLLDTDRETLATIGARTVELERHFNNQRGFDRGDDRLPYDLPGFEDALSEYYELRGWTEEGVVPEDPTGGAAAD